MMDDSDSDVVLENSPLYYHWKSYESETVKSTFNEDNKKIKADAPSEYLDKELPPLFKKIGGRWWKKIITRFGYTSEPSRTLSKTKTDFSVVKKLSALILGSNLLTEVDSSLLVSFTEEFISKEEPAWCASKGEDITRTIALCIVAFLSAVFSCNFLENVCCCLAFVIVLSGTVIGLVYSNFYSSNFEENERRVTDIIKDLRTLLQLLRKGIRMIQEAELIARGFTLISIRPPMNIETPAIQKPGQQCPELRETIFKYSRELFLTYRSKTLLLLGNFPLRANMDITSHDLARVELSQLGKLFSSKINFSEGMAKRHFAELTNNFSTSALKAMVDIMEVQQSELLRRLVFSFFAQIPSKDIWKMVNSCMDDLQHTVRDAVSVLQFVQLYFSCLTDKEVTREPTLKPVDNKTDKARPLKIAVHSLYLHLRAALVRVQALDEKIHSVDLSTSTSDSLLEFGTNTVNPALKEIEAELMAGTACFEESSLAANSFITSSPKQPAGIDKSISKMSEMVKSKYVAPIPIFEIGDPVIVDEVFEGSAERTEKKNESIETDFGLLKMEGKPISLMKELKSVLVVKAEEHKIREAKALGIQLENEIKCNAETSLFLDKPEIVNNTTDSEVLKMKPENLIRNLNIDCNPKLVPSIIESTDLNSISLVRNIAAQAVLKSQTYNMPSKVFGCEEEVLIGSTSEESEID